MPRQRNDIDLTHGGKVRNGHMIKGFNTTSIRMPRWFMFPPPRGRRWTPIEWVNEVHPTHPPILDYMTNPHKPLDK